MVFPRTGLPNRVTAYAVTPGEPDENDNPTWEATAFLDRPARFYRDVGRQLSNASDSIFVTGMVAFHAEIGDKLDMLPVESEIWIHDGQFKEAGDLHLVTYPQLMMLWDRPSHWEISVGRTRG